MCASQAAWWFFQLKGWRCDKLACKTWARARGPSPSPSRPWEGSRPGVTRCRHRRCVGLRSQRLCAFGLRWDRTSQLGKRGSLMRQRGQGHGLPAGGAPGLGGAVEPRFPPSVRPAWRAVPVRGRARGVCLLRFFVLALCRGVFFHSLRRRLIDPWRTLYHCGPLLRGSSEDCRRPGPTEWAAALWPPRCAVAPAARGLLQEPDGAAREGSGRVNV